MNTNRCINASLLFFTSLFLAGSAIAQTNQSWSASGNGSAYDELSSAATGAGRPPQSPCNHSGVPKKNHIDFVNDPTLNVPVYRFQLHTVDGNNTNSGCKTNDDDRGRNELIYETPVYYQKVQYKWKMKLADSFKVSNQSGIFHLHQLKYDGQFYKNEPMFTLSAVSDWRGKDLAVITSQDLTVNLPIVATRTPISTLAGKWLDIEEIVVFQKYGTGFGKYGIRISDAITGDVLLEYINNAIGTTKYGRDAESIEQKWGLYRDQKSDLQDESILFNDFEINYLADKGPITFSVIQPPVDQPPVEEVNLARSGTASQSSTYNDGRSGGLAGLANDGDTNGRWSNASVTHTKKDKDVAPWWEVDLQTTSVITNINIYNRTDVYGGTVPCCVDRLKNFTVSVIDANGIPVFSAFVENYPDPSATIDAGGVTGKVVRIELNDNEYLSLAEVEVYGSPTESTNDYKIFPEADAYVRGGKYDNDTFGNTSQLVLKNALPNEEYTRESFLRFNLNELPRNTGTAKLRMYVGAGHASVVDASWSVLAVEDDNWNESTVTWNTKPNMGSALIGGALLDVQNGALTGNYIEWDVTDQFLYELNSDRKISFKVTANPGDQNAWVVFSSREHSNVNQRPVLVIEQ